MIKPVFIFLYVFIVFNAYSLEIKPQEITKDGIYLNIGKEDGLKLYDELFDSKKNVKIKIIKISDNHSIACMLKKDGGCEEDINKALKLKNTVFLFSPEVKKEEKKVVFVRNDKEKFEEIPQKDIEEFKNTDKVFDLVIFNHDKNLRDADYRINGSVNFYTIAALELKETDLNYLNPIIQSDFNYTDKKQSLSLIFDANLFLQKKYSDKSFNLYTMTYSYKLNAFKFELGRNNLSDLGEFYLTDGLNIYYQKKKIKFGMISAFGIDYYNNMKTDFKHIYLGGYLKYKTAFLKNYDYQTVLGFVPEILDSELGVLPIYFNNTVNYKDIFNFDYQFKASYSKLDTEKEMYFNHYATVYSEPVDDLKVILGFDSREYLDLINHKYYETILEKIDSVKSKNAHFNISYKFDHDLLGFTFRRRFSYGGMNEFDLRYLNYNSPPFEYSVRLSSFMLKEVNIFAFNTDMTYLFSDNSMMTFNLLVMFEKLKLQEGKAMSFAPQISYYRKFFSYFYLKGQAEFELRTRKISAMLKLGYIFDTEIR